MYEYLDRSIIYLGSSDDLTRADRVILGVPMDMTTSFRPGTRLGPVRVREVTFTGGIEAYSVALDRSLEDISFYDAGDIVVAHGNLAESLRRTRAAADMFLAQGKKLFTIGGEHLISLPLIQAYHACYPDLAVIQFDAHADLRDVYLGESLSHATVMRRVLELVGDKSLFQCGIRSGDREEIAYGRGHSHLYLGQTVTVMDEIKAEIGSRPVYITLDIDVLDPAFAPGTGTPETGGTTSRELLDCLYQLRELNVVGFDLVEISPPLEVGDMTSIVGAKILREALLSF
jgi:agmatinase